MDERLGEMEDLLAQLERNSVPRTPYPGEEELNQLLELIVKDDGATAAEDNGPHYQRRVLCYMDVLGTTTNIERCEAERAPFFEIAGLFGTIHGFLSQYALREERTPAQVLVSGFSDHVVVSGPDSADGVRRVLRAAHDLYGRLLVMNQKLLRGAVVVGQLYHKEGIVFGPALIEAYRIESSEVCAPCIAATADVIELGHGTDNLSVGAPATMCPRMRELHNGLYHLDPIGTACASYRDVDIRFGLQEAAKDLLKASTPKLREKGAWIARLLLA